MVFFVLYFELGQLCCFRPENEYWFGLHKLLPTQWYDDNPSTYRKWTGDEPTDPSRCAVYTMNGFRDEHCDQSHYYMCKKAAGSHICFVLYSM